MNPSPAKEQMGRVGELFVQAQLLIYGVESVEPLVDSGTDLIAIRPGTKLFRTIQVKTTMSPGRVKRPKGIKRVDLVAVVQLTNCENGIAQEMPSVYLVTKAAYLCLTGSLWREQIGNHILNRRVAEEIFPTDAE
jgi:hypothetical protein